MGSPVSLPFQFPLTTADVGLAGVGAGELGVGNAAIIAVLTCGELVYGSQSLF